MPLVGPDGLSLLGGSLLIELLGRAGRPLAWVLLDLLLALALQAVAALALVWIFGNPRSLRLLLLLAVVPGGFVLLQWCYFSAIPARFLIEGETAREHGDWPVSCVASGHAIMAVRARPVVRAAPTVPLWVTDVLGRSGRIRPPVCEVTASQVGGTAIVLMPAATSDRYLFSRESPRAGRQWWHVAGPGATPVRVAPPLGHQGLEGLEGTPVLSADGEWVAWLGRVTGSSPPAFAAFVGPAQGSADMTVSLERLPPGSVLLLDLDVPSRELMVAVDQRQFAAVGLDGALRWGPVAPEGVATALSTFRRVGDGWVAWDAHRDGAPYRLAWSLAKGKGQHQVPRGRRIAAVAVDPEGTLIAVSLTSAEAVGDLADTVYVLRVADGVEVFRRFFTREAGSQVAFTADHGFAYTHWDGVRHEVRLLRIPD